MSQYLIVSRHRAVRGPCFALQDRPATRHDTLDRDFVVIEVADGLSLREAVAAASQDAVSRMEAGTWTNC